MNAQPFVVAEDHGPVRWLTLSRPERKNAVPLHGWDEITAALDAFAASPQRVVVLTGAGGDFCSGADLAVKELDELRSPAIASEHMKKPGRAATALHRLPKPSIAAVDGAAMGAGMNLALGCDIVVASEDAQFAEIFVKRGLGLDFGGTWLLPRMIGMARARELAFTGRVVAADEALALGLVSRVVPGDQLRATATDLAKDLAEGAPLAQQFIKTGLSRSFELSFEQAIAYEDQAQAALLGSDDLREGVAAFLERRQPRFEGS